MLPSSGTATVITHCWKANPLISVEWLEANTPLADADYYLCGPRPFLRAFVGGLAQAGVRSDRIHYEFFGPADELLAA